MTPTEKEKEKDEKRKYFHHHCRCDGRIFIGARPQESSTESSLVQCLDDGGEFGGLGQGQRQAGPAAEAGCQVIPGRGLLASARTSRISMYRKAGCFCLVRWPATIAPQPPPIRFSNSAHSSGSSSVLFPFFSLWGGDEGTVSTPFFTYIHTYTSQIHTYIHTYIHIHLSKKRIRVLARFARNQFYCSALQTRQPSLRHRSVSCDEGSTYAASCPSRVLQATETS